MNFGSLSSGRMIAFILAKIGISPSNFHSTNSSTLYFVPWMTVNLVLWRIKANVSNTLGRVGWGINCNKPVRLSHDQGLLGLSPGVHVGT